MTRRVIRAMVGIWLLCVIVIVISNLIGKSKSPGRVVALITSVTEPYYATTVEWVDLDTRMTTEVTYDATLDAQVKNCAIFVFMASFEWSAGRVDWNGRLQILPLNGGVQNPDLVTGLPNGYYSRHNRYVLALALTGKKAVLWNTVTDRFTLLTLEHLLPRTSYFSQDSPYVAWSPDERHVAISTFDDDASTLDAFYLVDAASGAVTELPLRNIERGIAWSDNGRWLAVSDEKRPVVYLMNPQGQLHTELHLPDISRWLMWLPDDQGLMAVVYDGSYTYYHWRPGSADFEKTSLSFNAFAGYPSPDHSQLYVSDGTNRIIQMPAGELIVELPHLSQAVRLYWSPDNRYVFIHDPLDKFFLVDIPQKMVTPLPADWFRRPTLLPGESAEMMPVNWLPDSSALVAFDNLRMTLHIFRINDGNITIDPPLTLPGQRAEPRFCTLN